jgi:hypothetical protein
MGESDHRQISRDSLFVLAEVRLDGIEAPIKVKVRNLSSGGMMAEGVAKPQRGQVAWVDVRNIGWVEGSVAWVQGNRFGIAFREEIDPKIARAPAASSDDPLIVPRRPMMAGGQPDASLRKI